MVYERLPHGRRVVHYYPGSYKFNKYCLFYFLTVSCPYYIIVLRSYTRDVTFLFSGEFISSASSGLNIINLIEYEAWVIIKSDIFINIFIVCSFCTRGSEGNKHYVYIFLLGFYSIFNGCHINYIFIISSEENYVGNMIF